MSSRGAAWGGAEGASGAGAAADTRVPARRPWLDHALLATFALIWGANFLLAELALRQLSPIGFSVSRFVVAAGALFAFGLVGAVRADDARAGHVLRGRPWTLLAAAVIGVVLAPWLGIEGLARTHAGRAALYVSLAPALSLLLSGGVRRDGRAAASVGAALLVGGAALLVVDPAALRVSIGDLLLLLAALAALLELHLVRPLASAFGPAHASAWRTLVGGVLYLAVAAPWLVSEPWGSLDAVTWLAVWAGGAVGVGLGQWVKARAVRTLGPTKVLAWFNVVPVATLALRALVFGRPPAPVELVACAALLAGAALINRSRAA